MFLSFFKKKETSTSENVTPTTPPPEPPTMVNLEAEKVEPENLPGWKDKAIWSESNLKLEPNVEHECRELQYTITGDTNHKIIWKQLEILI